MNKKKSEEGVNPEDKKPKEGEGEGKKDDFAKDEKDIDINRYNQTLRKAREAEAEKRELEEENRKLQEAIKKGTKPEQQPPQSSPPTDDEEDDEEDDFWGDDEWKKKQSPAAPQQAPTDPEAIKSIINEQIRPFVEAETQRKKIEKKKARQSFYDKHPEYLSDADKWAELLEELGNSIVPSGDYYQDLEKAHRIIGGEDTYQAQIEQKKKEFANDAGTGGDGGSNAAPAGGQDGDYKFSPLDKKIMEGTGVDAETIKKMRQLQKEGKLSLEF